MQAEQPSGLRGFQVQAAREPGGTGRKCTAWSALIVGGLLIGAVGVLLTLLLTPGAVLLYGRRRTFLIGIAGSTAAAAATSDG
jgi:hypothetical protein